MFKQEIECALDRGRGRISMPFAQMIEQIVRLDRFARGRNELQHFLAQRRETQTALLTGVLHCRDEFLGTVVVMVHMRFDGMTVAQRIHLDFDNTPPRLNISAEAAVAWLIWG